MQPLVRKVAVIRRKPTIFKISLETNLEDQFSMGNVKKEQGIKYSRRLIKMQQKLNMAPNHRKNHARNSCLRENPSKNRSRLNNTTMQDVRKESRSKDT